MTVNACICLNKGRRVCKCQQSPETERRQRHHEKGFLYANVKKKKKKKERGWSSSTPQQTSSSLMNAAINYRQTVQKSLETWKSYVTSILVTQNNAVSAVQTTNKFYIVKIFDSNETQTSNF